MRVALLIVLLSANAWAATYYVSPSGSSSNTGLSTSSPWSMSYALSHVSANDTIMVMDGGYPGDVQVGTSGVTIKAVNKWHCWFTNSSEGNLIATAQGVTFDGLTSSNAHNGGIEFYAPFCAARNCWISYAGKNNAGSQAGSGVAWHGYNSNTVDSCLIELNGSSPGYDHGIYGSGTNCVIRNNVIRQNYAFGIQCYGNGGGYNWKVYNNLIYGNGTQPGTSGAAGLWVSTSGGTNDIFGNTVVEYANPPFHISGGTIRITNNIVLKGSGNYYDYLSGTVLADYNCSTNAMTYAGPHDITASPSSIGFVNASNGLFWLSSSSAAKAQALPGVFGSVDFFSNPQSNVTDIGAFQFSPSLSVDARILDPSTSSGADYWSPQLSTSTINVGTMNVGSFLIQLMQTK